MCGLAATGVTPGTTEEGCFARRHLLHHQQHSSHPLLGARLGSPWDDTQYQAGKMTCVIQPF